MPRKRVATGPKGPLSVVQTPAKALLEALLEWRAMSAGTAKPLVGSKSDRETMAHTAKALDALGIAYG